MIHSRFVFTISLWRSLVAHDSGGIGVVGSNPTRLTSVFWGVAKLATAPVSEAGISVEGSSPSTPAKFVVYCGMGEPGHPASLISWRLWFKSRFRDHIFDPVSQMDRVFASEAKCWWFESVQGRWALCVVMDHDMGCDVVMCHVQSRANEILCALCLHSSIG